MTPDSPQHLLRSGSASPATTGQRAGRVPHDRAPQCEGSKAHRFLAQHTHCHSCWVLGSRCSRQGRCAWSSPRGCTRSPGLLSSRVCQWTSRAGALPSHNCCASSPANVHRKMEQHNQNQQTWAARDCEQGGTELLTCRPSCTCNAGLQLVSPMRMQLGFPASAGKF